MRRSASPSHRIIVLPLAATTELVAGKGEAAEFAYDIEATLPKCSPSVVRRK